MRETTFSFLMLRMRLISIDQKRRLIFIASELGMSSSVYYSTGRGLISLVDIFVLLFITFNICLFDVSCMQY